MSTFYNDSFSAEQPNKVLADFLKQSVETVSCELLAGGSEEGKLAKCIYGNTSYVIKFFSDPAFGNNEIVWTRHAFELGIGPQVYYAHPMASYIITEFIQGSSLVPATANTPVVIQGVASALAHLHHSSLPSARASESFERIGIKYKKLHCSGQLQDILERAMRYIESIRLQFQTQGVANVPCHNDLNWGNVFVNGNHVTLIDWGDATLDNPYCDIATFLVLNVINPEFEKLFFERYDVHLLEPEWQTYMRLCKQLVYFEFALNLLFGVQTGDNALLHTEHVSVVGDIDSYLSCLAARNVEVNSVFLYEMAVASLSRMMEMRSV